MNRTQQIREKAALDFFEKEGRMPSTSELNKLVKNKALYKPLVNPVVPKKGAVSRSEVVNKNLNEMIDERKNIAENAAELHSRLKRIKEVIEAETSNFLEKTSHILKKYKHDSENVLLFDDVLPPLQESSNILYGPEGVKLERSESKELKYKLNAKAFNEQGAGKLRTLKAADPMSLVALGTGGIEKGAELSIELHKGNSFISELVIDIDPINIRIYLDDSDTIFLDKFIQGRESLAIGRKTSTIKVVLYETPSSVNIRVRELKLYSTGYSGSGEYTYGEYLTPPIEVKLPSFILDSSQYTPEGTNIRWFYAPDILTGVLLGSGKQPNNAESLSDLTFAGTGGSYLNYSEIYNYTLGTVAETLTWTEFDASNPVDWNSTPSTNITAAATKNKDYINIGVLDSGFDINTVRVQIGKGAWIYRSAEVGGSYTIQTNFIVPPGGYTLDFINPTIPFLNTGLFRSMIIKGGDVEEEIKGLSIDSFTYDLPEGTYLVSLEFYQTTGFSFKNDTLLINDEEYSIREALAMGKTIDYILNDLYSIPVNFSNLSGPDLIGRTVEIIALPVTYRNDIDEVLYSKDFNINKVAVQPEGTVWVPYIRGNGDYDIIHPSSGIYSDPALVSTFYDISYKSRTDTDLTKVFLRAVLEGSSSESPIIRSVKLTSE